MSDNLQKVMDLANEDLLKTGGIERERAIRHMHIYFVRALWRWFTATEESDDEWKAHAHMKMALLMLQQAQEA
jgi:hypothetical protein